MSNSSINGLNAADFTVGEHLTQVTNLRESPIPAIANAATEWLKQASVSLASGSITLDMGVSEACLANQTTFGAAEARLSAARMQNV